jgi:hypothetical protein
MKILCKNTMRELRIRYVYMIILYTVNCLPLQCMLTLDSPIHHIISYIVPYSHVLSHVMIIIVKYA